MTRIKICGITNLQDALDACSLGVDALGFIFSKSPRQIKIEEAEKIISQIPPFITTVGTFADETPEFVANIYLKCKIDTFQFHGKESPYYIMNFLSQKVIKVFSIKDKNSLKDLKKYLQADAFLLDTFSKDKKGGTGKTFNWDLALKAKKYKKPIILSGGLNPENVELAIKKVKPYAVDVSSGVEESPGKKDYQKMKEFIERVKRMVD